MQTRHTTGRARRAARIVAPLLVFGTTFGAVTAAAATTDDMVAVDGTSRAWPESAEEQEESHEWEVEFEMTAFSWEFFFGELAPPPEPDTLIVRPAPGGGRG